MNYKTLLTLLCLLTASGIVSASGDNPQAREEAMVVAGNARFTLLTPNMVRMEWCDSARFEDNATLAIVNRQMQTPDFHVKRKKSELIITTEAMRIVYRTGESFSDNNPRVEFKMNNRLITWTPQSRDTLNLKGTTRTLDGYDGNIRTRTGKPLELEEGIISRGGWTLIDESERHLLVDSDSQWGKWVAERPAGSHIDWYLLAYGHDYKKALRDFTSISGRVPLPPKYSFGYWWSHYWQYSDNELRELVDMMHSLSLPLDVMVVDMDWHETYGLRKGDPNKDEFGERIGWTGYSWQKELFPSPENFLKEMERQEVRVALNLHPASGIRTVEDIYPAFAQAYQWDSIGKSIPFRIDEIKWADTYFDTVLRPMERMGVDFWWLDWQQWLESKYTKGLSNTFWLNHTFHHDKLLHASERPMIYHRWGGLGSHRYQVAFSGDTKASWKMLGYLPYFTATASNVCYGYWGHDVGGHVQQGVETNPELYTRWLQSGVFMPIYKTHATKDIAIERRIWCFPDHFEQMRAALRLRYALTPYIYTAARTCTDTGVSICRPLYYEYPEQNEAYEHPQEYFFGNDILATCIDNPIDKDGLARREIWFPEGKWYDMARSAFIEGGRTYELHYTLDENPYYVRAGAILPMTADTIRNLRRENTRLVLTVIPGNNGEASLYEDDGISSDYVDQFATTRFTHRSNGNTTTLTIHPRQGSYENMPVKRGYTLKFRSTLPPERITVNGDEVPYARFAEIGTWTYDGLQLTTEVFTSDVECGKQTVIELTFGDQATSGQHLLDGKSSLFGRCRTLTKEFKYVFGKLFPWTMLPRTYLQVSQTPNFITEHPEQLVGLLEEFDTNLRTLIEELQSIEGIDPGFIEKVSRQLEIEPTAAKVGSTTESNAN